MKFTRYPMDTSARGFRWHIEWTKREKVFYFWLPRWLIHPSRPLFHYWKY